jgi:hypothetical protein
MPTPARLFALVSKGLLLVPIAWWACATQVSTACILDILADAGAATNRRAGSAIDTAFK